MINFLTGLFRNHSVSILNKSWQPIKVVKVKHIPRFGEYIYLEDTHQYYAVLNVVYNLNEKQGIFIIVEEHGNETPKNRTEVLSSR